MTKIRQEQEPKNGFRFEQSIDLEILRDEFHEGSWVAMLKYLYEKIEKRPVVHKIRKQIQEDVQYIENNFIPEMQINKIYKEIIGEIEGISIKEVKKPTQRTLENLAIELKEKKTETITKEQHDLNYKLGLVIDKYIQSKKQ